MDPPSLSTSVTVTYDAPVGNAELVYCKLYLTVQQLLPRSFGKTWLKVNVDQVDFGVGGDDRSNDFRGNFVDEVEIEIKLSDELIEGCTRVIAVPGIYEPELTEQHQVRYGVNLNPCTPIISSFGVHRSRYISTSVKAFGWLPAFKDPVVTKRVEWKWECRRWHDAYLFHKGRIIRFGLGAMPKPPYDPRVVQYLPQEFKGEASWELLNEALDQSNIKFTVKVTLHTRYFRRVCVIGYVASPGKVHSYECPLSLNLAPSL